MKEEYKIIIQTINEQNKFILNFFNDNRIPDEIKKEYVKKYNELQLKYPDINK